MNIKDIAQKIGAQILNPKGQDENTRITGVAPIHRAGPSEVTFFTNPKFIDQVHSSKAAAVILKEEIPNCPIIQLIHSNPQEAMALASQCFFEFKHHFEGKSPAAVVDKSAKLGKKVTVYPLAYIDAGAHIGEGTVIYPHVYIGANAKIGSDCILFPGAVVMSDAQIGDRVIIHPNAVVGADGFGFASGQRGITKIPQIGKVVVESDVEIGSLSNIDRATFDQTYIGKSTKIDSHVQIGHNVEIGDYSILCSQFGVAGSTKIGKRFLAAGQSAVNQGITIGDGVTIGGRTGVTSSLPDGGTYLGLPAKPANEWKKEVIAIARVPELLKRVQELEEKIKNLSSK